METYPVDIVIDTNVLIAGMQSPRGASFQLLRLLGQDYFTVHVSVPLVLEYESIAKRKLDELPIGSVEVDTVIDYLCSVAQPHEIHFVWRPILRDPNDEMVLELAVASKSKVIVTFNRRDYQGCEYFGIQALTPAEFLRMIEVIK